MSTMIIDNPQYLRALAENMNALEHAATKFIENIRSAVQTTVDQLTRIIIVLEDKIKKVSEDQEDLYDQLSSCPEDDHWQRHNLLAEIKLLQMKISRIKKKRERCEQIKLNISYQYSTQVKKYEGSAFEHLSGYPKAIDGLEQMEVIMNRYLAFSSELITTPMNADHRKPVSAPVIQKDEYTYYQEKKEKEDRTSLHSMSFGKLKNGNLTDQILFNAELEAQQKRTKFLQFEISDRDRELCLRSGYRIFNKSNKMYAVKDLYNEIDLEKEGQSFTL